MNSPLQRHVFFLALAFMLTSGCVTGRLSQFRNFANAGASYEQASQAVLMQAGTAAIEADSLIAIQGRSSLTTPEERRRYILESDQELRKRLSLLDKIAQHGKLLQCYFETLAELADPHAPPELETEAGGLYDAIIQMSPGLKNSNFGSAKIQDKIPQATDFGVAVFRVKALESELKSRAQAIERELALQEAAFRAIVDMMTADLTASLQLHETQDVINPFATATTLSTGWVDRRQDILKARVAAESMQCVVDAIGQLRENFKALAGNTLSVSALRKTIASVHSIKDFKEAIQKVSH